MMKPESIDGMAGDVVAVASVIMGVEVFLELDN